MITIDQLLESVDLDFEPRFVTKDEDGEVDIWSERPNKGANGWWGGALSVCCETFDQQIAEFDGKDWSECIYKVPQKTTENIKKLKTTEKQKENKMEQKFTISKLKEYISAIKTMGFDEETSEVRISDGIIYIDDKKNNKSATIVEKMLSITMYDTVINEKGEQNV